MKRALSLLGVVLLVACGARQVTVRASSVPYLGASGSSLHVKLAAKDVVSELQSLFDKRGFHLVSRYPAKDGSNDALYAFKGTRDVRTLGAVSTDVAGYTGGEIATYSLGSVFYARIHADGSSTEVLVLGKPTLDGQEVCSDADVLLRSFEYWCVDTKLGNGGPILPFLRGREEADTARGVLLELGQAAAKPPSG